MTTLQMQLATLKAYLSDHHLAVLSTVDDTGSPQSAVVGYSCIDELSLVIATYTNSRKHVNLQTHDRVSLVIGWDDGKTLQYEGTCRQLHGDAMHEAASRHYERVPTVSKYLIADHQVIYRIDPVWVRLIDFHHDPWRVWEWGGMNN